MARVLIADDDVLVRKTVHAILTRHGHEVIEAVNGLDAVASVRSAPVDLVILDVVMPVAGGVHALAEIKRQFPTIKAIVMSGWELRDGIDMFEVARTFGAERTMRKPFTPRELVDAVAELLSIGEE